MARITDSATGNAPHSQTIIEANGQESVSVPDSAYIANAAILREGMDLILQLEDGSEIVIANYFAQPLPPVITSPEGAQLSPDMVESFVQPASIQYAQSASTAMDESPVGTVGEVTGTVTITRANGQTETAHNGTRIYEGDIVETDAAGAVNIVFIDETNFSISNNARLAIDEYVFDPESESGETHFSVLRGMFVFVSGLIGRDDPDDVEINTPVGSIGIRGTTIAGNVDTGEITVIEGAIVLRSPDGRSEMTLARQFETAKFNTQNGTIEPMGVTNGNDIGTRFAAMNDVNPAFFAAVGSTAPTSDAPVNNGDNATDPQAPQQGAPQNGSAPAQGETSPGNQGPNNQTPNNQTPNAPAQTAPEKSGYNDTNFDGNTEAGFAESTGTAPVSNGALSGTVTTGSTVTGTANGGTTVTAGGTDSGTTGSGTITTTVPPVTTNVPPGVINGGGANDPAGATILQIHALGAGDGIRIPGTIPGSLFGSAVAGGGDMNGDGLADFMIIRAPISGGGYARVYDGNGSVITTETIGAPARDAQGAIVGDMDGDGNSDFIIGASGMLGSAGYGEIISSGGSLFSNTPAGYELGASVAAIGDINSDGYNDVLYGAPGANGGQGKAFVIYGGASIPTLLDFDDSFSPGTPNFQSFSQGFAMGETGLSGFGTDVGGAGDFNNDGYADFMMSDPGNGNVYIGFGENYLPGLAIGGGTVMTISGLTATTTDRTPLFNMGDMNGDGLTDIAIGDGAADGGRAMIHVIYGNAGYNMGSTYNVTNPTNGFTIRLDGADGTIVGGGSAGDFDGDGLNDMAVAVNNGDIIDVYVIYGRTGLSGTITLTDSFIANNALHMQYDPLHDGGAVSPSGTYDLEIHSPGDVDGDGYDDLLIGSPHYDNNTGEAFIVYGRNSAGRATEGTTATANGQSLIGTTGDDVFGTGSFGGLRLHGGNGNDTFNLSAAVSDLHGGAGYDTVRLMNNNMVLDFAALGNEGLSGVEEFMLTGMNQTLRLGLDDIFRLLQQSDNGELVIDSAGSGNSLIIEADAGTGTDEFYNLASTYGFDSQGTEVRNGISYDEYSFGSGYTLLIDQNLAVADAV